MILSSHLQSVQWLNRRWEIAYPLMFGLVSGVVTWKYAPWAFSCAKQNLIHLENIYTAVAGIFAIITGFVASFYCTVQSLADTRFQRVARAPFFLRFLSQMKEATIAGFALAIISIPFVIVMPDDPGSWWFTRVTISIWFGLSAYALAAFIRVGRWLFIVFERRPPDYDGAG